MYSTCCFASELCSTMKAFKAGQTLEPRLSLRFTFVTDFLWCRRSQLQQACTGSSSISFSRLLITNSFIDQGEFGAMKMLSGRIAPRCDKHQFCDKMTVFELFSSYRCMNKVVVTKKERKKTKNGTFATTRFCV